MLKKSINIAMAFVGVVVGAGFASGQEALQFFVAFGPWGILGAALTGITFGITGMIVLRFGSYFLANEHTAVFNKVSHPIVARVIDYGIMATLFAVGFVMFAGAGANLEQQFGLPTWIGALIMLVLVIATGFLDIDKVSTVIGAATPVIAVFLIMAMVIAVRQAPSDLGNLQPYAEQVQTGLPNWWISSLNYLGFNVIVAASMSIVIGGSHHDTRAAGWGGLIGGILFGFLLVGLVVSLWVALPVVGEQDMPTLALVNEANPVLGNLMAVVIFMMIYNTAIGMFYSMSRRMTVDKPARFRTVYVAMCLVGFVLSFVGFKALVSVLYPLLGYVGLILIVALLSAYARGRSRITAEIERRETIRELLVRKLHPRAVFTKRHERKLRAEVAASPASDTQLEESIASEVTQELIDDGHLELEQIEPADQIPRDLVGKG
ncbi:hypothetical protein CKALI_10380 [Corynebacterium kalinowskii]|uniref:Membrane protein YkvI n=1 Tax=Corynebacterium kalinowskii TaxID=2675216 RepID=A0A6B8VTJ5_9CORY|nr:hypothetical protein [Corynebacterium kalinowskii]QGU02927.1 hypothetical protein CKALI_10380 [Corynebacterium kalinowskii]